MSESTASPVKVWDLPTRLFHWSFALVVMAAVITVKVGGTWMDWHPPLGIMALMLLLFRLIWGFTGSRYARFSSFVRGPRAVWAYVRHGVSVNQAGHSPLGGWSVLALLLVVGLQATTGLFATDDILTAGPLNGFVSSETASIMTSIHKWNENVLFGLVGLHLAAIAFYAVRGKQLVPPMLTGNVKAVELAPNNPSARDDIGLKAWALVLILGLSYLGWWLYGLGMSTPMSF